MVLCAFDNRGHSVSVHCERSLGFRSFYSLSIALADSAHILLCILYQERIRAYVC